MHVALRMLATLLHLLRQSQRGLLTIVQAGEAWNGQSLIGRPRCDDDEYDHRECAHGFPASALTAWP